MRIAIRAHDLGTTTLSGMVDALEQTGFDGVQLVSYKAFDDVTYTKGGITRERASEIGDALKQAGRQVFLIGAYFNPVHSNEQKVQGSIAIFKEYIDCAKLLGCDFVGSETGSFNDDKWTYNPLNRTESARKRVVEVFTELCDYASQHSVNVAIEGAFGHVCFDVATLNKAVEEINRPNLRVIFDLYNYLDISNYKNYLEILREGLETFGDRILLFHLKDFVVEDGKLKQCALGQGLFDYESILKQIGYDRNAILVFEGVTGESIKPSLDYIKRIIDRI